MTHKTHEKVTIEQFEKALRNNGGWFAHTATALGLTHQAVSRRVKGSTHLQKVVADTKAEHLDLAESKVIRAIKNNEPWAICFYLKCQGKERGWVERQEHGHVGELNINVVSYTDK